jgi:hypothetical protein
MNYTLFIMMGKEMVSMEEKRQLAASLAASPLLSSQSDLYCVFYVFLPPHHGIARGVEYIVDFRSR